MKKVHVCFMAAVMGMIIVMFSTPALSDTIAYWQFEPGVELTDSSSYGNNLDDLRQSTGSTNGIVDPIPRNENSNIQKLSFSGAAGQLGPRHQVLVGDEFCVANDLTVEAFIRADSENAVRRIASLFRWNSTVQKKFSLYQDVHNINFSVYDIAGNPITAYTTIYSNEDAYVVGRYDSSTGKATVDIWYINGGAHDGTHLSAAASFATATNLYAPTANDYIDIGMANSSAGGAAAANFWDGMIDEVRISDTVLGNRELLNFDDTLAYYRFESGEELKDSSRFSNNLDDQRGAVNSAGGIVNPIPNTGISNMQKLSFDGSVLGPRHRVLVGDEICVANDLTVEAYIRADTENAVRRIASLFTWSYSQKKFSLYQDIHNIKFDVFDVDGNIKTASTTIYSGEDAFVVGRYDSSTGEATVDIWYINGGAHDGTHLSATASFGSATNLYAPTSDYYVDIGMANSSGGAANFWDGMIDEVRITALVLDDADLLNVPPPPPRGTLIVIN